MTDPYNLQRFVDAQKTVYDRACSELRQGRKTSHWMWFIFPQLKGLGFSETAQRFAISSIEEAEAFLAHPTLGPRLNECAELVVLVEGQTASEIFGYPDDLKFRSCMTLFAHATSENAVFRQALNKYFSGEFDPATLKLLQQ
jgi:uncharacterized protein (DUF1810 family)